MPILKYFAESQSDVLLDRNVTPICLGIPAIPRNLAHHLPGGGFVDVQNVDTSSGRGECFGSRSPNTTSASGHYCNFMSETQRIASCFQMNNLLDRNYLKCPGICVAHSNYQCTWSGPLSSVDRLQVLEDSQSLLGVRIIRLQVQRGPQLLLRFVDLAGSSIEQPEVPVQVRAL